MEFNEEFIKSNISKESVQKSNIAILNLTDPKKLNEMLIFSSLFILVYEYLQNSMIKNLEDFFYFEFVEKFMPEEKEFIKRIVFWYKTNKCIDDDDLKNMKEMTDRRNDFAHDLLNQLSIGLQKKDYDLFDKLVLLEKKIRNWWFKNITLDLIWDFKKGDIEEFRNDDEKINESTYSIYDILLKIANTNDDSYKDYFRNYFSKIEKFYD